MKASTGKKTPPTQRGLGSIYRRMVTEADGTEREIPTWHIQFSVNGRQYRESTHSESYNEAQRFLKKRISEVSTGKFQGIKVDRTLVSDLLKDVIADYALKDRHSIDTMARPLIDNHLKPYFGGMRASNLKMPTITAYVRQRKEAGAAAASINRELALLRRAFKLGTVNGLVSAAHVPDFTQLLQKEKNARQGFWEHSEYETFRDALPVDERAMFIFGYWTGCRFGEIAQLECAQVDLEGCAVRLREDQTKPGEPRVIPLGGPGNDLHDMLVDQQKQAALRPDSPWVFFRQGSINPKKESARRGREVMDIRKDGTRPSRTLALTGCSTTSGARASGIWYVRASPKRWPCLSVATKPEAFSSGTTSWMNGTYMTRLTSCTSICTPRMATTRSDPPHPRRTDTRNLHSPSPREVLC
jgi:integrase